MPLTLSKPRDLLLSSRADARRQDAGASGSSGGAVR